MWISVILAIISFLTAKKSGISTSKAALAGVAVGAGTYYVATQTDWGKATIGKLDSFISGDSSSEPLKDASGATIVDPVTGTSVTTPSSTTSKTGESTMSTVGKWFSDNLGLVAGVATGAAVGGLGIVPIIGIGVIAYLVLK